MHQYPTFTGATSSGPGMTITWQQGPMADGVNGAMPELPVRAVIDRLTALEQLQPCQQNHDAIILLHAVLACSTRAFAIVTSGASWVPTNRS